MGGASLSHVCKILHAVDLLILKLCRDNQLERRQRIIRSSVATQATFNFVALIMKPTGSIEEKQTDESQAGTYIFK